MAICLRPKNFGKIEWAEGRRENDGPGGTIVKQ